MSVYTSDDGDSRRSSPDPIVLPSSPIAPLSDRSRRSVKTNSISPLKSRSTNTSMRISPSKSFVLEPPASAREGVVSPWRVKVTLEEQVRQENDKRGPGRPRKGIQSSATKRARESVEREVKRPARRRRRDQTPMNENSAGHEKDDVITGMQSIASRRSARVARQSHTRISDAQHFMRSSGRKKDDYTISMNEDFSMVSMESLLSTREASALLNLRMRANGESNKSGAVSALSVSYLPSSPPANEDENSPAQVALYPDIAEEVEEAEHEIKEEHEQGYDMMSWQPTGRPLVHIKEAKEVVETTHVDPVSTTKSVRSSWRPSDANRYRDNGSRLQSELQSDYLGQEDAMDVDRDSDEDMARGDVNDDEDLVQDDENVDEDLVQDDENDDDDIDDRQIDNGGNAVAGLQQVHVGIEASDDGYIHGRHENEQEDNDPVVIDEDEDIWQEEASRPQNIMHDDPVLVEQYQRAQQRALSSESSEHMDQQRESGTKKSTVYNFEDLFSDEPPKPVRGKIPRTWRRLSGMDFSYVDSPAHVHVVGGSGGRQFQQREQSAHGDDAGAREEAVREIREDDVQHDRAVHSSRILTPPPSTADEEQNRQRSADQHGGRHETSELTAPDAEATRVESDGPEEHEVEERHALAGRQTSRISISSKSSSSSAEDEVEGGSDEEDVDSKENNEDDEDENGDDDTGLFFQNNMPHIFAPRISTATSAAVAAEASVVNGEHEPAEHRLFSQQPRRPRRPQRRSTANLTDLLDLDALVKESPKKEKVVTLAVPARESLKSSSLIGDRIDNSFVQRMEMRRQIREQRRLLMQQQERKQQDPWRELKQVPEQDQEQNEDGGKPRSSERVRIARGSVLGSQNNINSVVDQPAIVQNAIASPLKRSLLRSSKMQPGFVTGSRMENQKDPVAHHEPYRIAQTQPSLKGPVTQESGIRKKYEDDDDEMTDQDVPSPLRPQHPSRHNAMRSEFSNSAHAPLHSSSFLSYEEQLNLTSPHKVKVNFNDSSLLSSTASNLRLSPGKHDVPPRFKRMDPPAVEQATTLDERAAARDRSSSLTLIERKSAPKPGLLSRMGATFWAAIIRPTGPSEIWPDPKSDTALTLEMMHEAKTSDRPTTAVHRNEPQQGTMSAHVASKDPSHSFQPYHHQQHHKLDTTLSTILSEEGDESTLLQQTLNPILRTALRTRYGVVSATFPWKLYHMRVLHRLHNSLFSGRLDTIVPSTGPLPTSLHHYIDTTQISITGGDFHFSIRHAYVVQAFLGLLVSAEIVHGMMTGEVDVLGDRFSRELRSECAKGDEVLHRDGMRDGVWVTEQSRGKWVEALEGDIGVEFIIRALGDVVLEEQRAERKRAEETL